MIGSPAQNKKQMLCSMNCGKFSDFVWFKGNVIYFLCVGCRNKIEQGGENATSTG